VLDVAADAVESAYAQRAFDEVALAQKRRSLRAERDWLRTLELDTTTQYP